MKKICSNCKQEMPATAKFFYKKSADNQNILRNKCKQCMIVLNNKNKQLRRKKGFEYWTTIKRRKDKAKQLGITYENWRHILYQRDIISTKKKQLDKLKKRLNKFVKQKKDSMYYKKYYQICSQEWQELTKNKPQENTLIYKIKYKYDTDFNLKERLRNQLSKQKKKYPNLDYAIRQAVSNNQNTKYLDILGYKKEQLKSHLEKQFTKDMTWKAFRNGDIHIDHIKPQSLFNLKDINDIKECWSLNNLQPLWAKDNIIKSNKYKEK
jgi:hypothetical protein